MICQVSADSSQEEVGSCLLALVREELAKERGQLGGLWQVTHTSGWMGYLYCSIPLHVFVEVFKSAL